MVDRVKDEAQRELDDPSRRNGSSDEVQGLGGKMGIWLISYDYPSVQNIVELQNERRTCLSIHKTDTKNNLNHFQLRNLVNLKDLQKIF